MKERPILFSAPMVRALLAGTKTQTRRVLKPAGKYRLDLVAPTDGGPSRCPYGVPGDLLWVREAWAGSLANLVASQDEAQVGTQRGMVAYRATFQGERSPWGKWRPSIHMPRWASRILLEVTEVRVERLQDISEDDAEAEGITQDQADAVLSIAEAMGQREPRPFASAYETLWDDINGAGAWDANPWVWCVSFRRIEQ